MPLSRKFPTYIEGMMKIEEAKVKSQSETDKILKDYEEVSIRFPSFLLIPFSCLLLGLSGPPKAKGKKGGPAR
jgi:hypothetical protein